MKYLLPIIGLVVIVALSVTGPLATAGTETKATVFTIIFAASIAVGFYLDRRADAV